jgi:hypothetical protein
MQSVFFRTPKSSDAAPGGWNQWLVTAYSGKNRDVILRQTFVRAASAAAAGRLGRDALKLVGCRGRFNVSVRPYYPWLDVDMQRYLRTVSQDSVASAR